MKNIVSTLMVTVILVGTLTMALCVQPVKASGTIYIRADGSIDPATAPISTYDRITYTFTGNVYDGIVVERNNIVINGAGYTLQPQSGVSLPRGIDLAGRSGRPPTNVTIQNTQIKNFDYGIWFSSFSNHNSVSGNIITDNYYGIGLGNSSSYNSISGNTITDSFSGVWFSYSSYNSITGNTITNNYDGVWFSSSSYNSISGNNITANLSSGIGLSISSDNTISENNITNNYDYGIRLYNSSDNTISGNTIANNYDHGIWLYNSSNNSISGNSIEANLSSGIQLSSSSDYNRIIINNIANNVCGINIGYSSNNRFYHNNFIDNSQQVSIYEPEYANLWDDGYPSGGNYWSDYAGVDLHWGPSQNEIGSDGIGDAPRIIGESNRDIYPLMSPYEYWSNPILGDINRDTKVDNNDLFQLAKAYSSTPEKPNWNPNSDIDSDSTVNVLDLFHLGKSFGEP